MSGVGSEEDREIGECLFCLLWLTCLQVPQSLSWSEAELQGGLGLGGSAAKALRLEPLLLSLG